MSSTQGEWGHPSSCAYRHNSIQRLVPYLTYQLDPSSKRVVNEALHILLCELDASLLHDRKSSASLEAERTNDVEDRRMSIQKLDEELKFLDGEMVRATHKVQQRRRELRNIQATHEAITQQLIDIEKQIELSKEFVKSGYDELRHVSEQMTNLHVHAQGGSAPDEFLIEPLTPLTPTTPMTPYTPRSHAWPNAIPHDSYGHATLGSGLGNGGKTRTSSTGSPGPLFIRTGPQLSPITPDTPTTPLTPLSPRTPYTLTPNTPHSAHHFKFGSEHNCGLLTPLPSPSDEAVHRENNTPTIYLSQSSSAPSSPTGVNRSLSKAISKDDITIMLDSQSSRNAQDRSDRFDATAISVDFYEMTASLSDIAIGTTTPFDGDFEDIPLVDASGLFSPKSNMDSMSSVGTESPGSAGVFVEGGTPLSPQSGRTPGHDGREPRSRLGRASSLSPVSFAKSKVPLTMSPSSRTTTKSNSFSLDRKQGDQQPEGTEREQGMPPLGRSFSIELTPASPTSPSVQKSKSRTLVATQIPVLSHSSGENRVSMEEAPVHTSPAASFPLPASRHRTISPSSSMLELEKRQLELQQQQEYDENVYMGGGRVSSNRFSGEVGSRRSSFKDKLRRGSSKEWKYRNLRIMTSESTNTAEKLSAEVSSNPAAVAAASPGSSENNGDIDSSTRFVNDGADPSSATSGVHPEIEEAEEVEAEVKGIPADGHTASMSEEKLESMSSLDSYYKNGESDTTLSSILSGAPDPDITHDIVTTQSLRRVPALLNSRRRRNFSIDTADLSLSRRNHMPMLSPQRHKRTASEHGAPLGGLERSPDDSSEASSSHQRSQSVDRTYSDQTRLEMFKRRQMELDATSNRIGSGPLATTGSQEQTDIQPQESTGPKRYTWGHTESKGGKLSKEIKLLHEMKRKADIHKSNLEATAGTSARQFDRVFLAHYRSKAPPVPGRKGISVTTNNAQGTVNTSSAQQRNVFAGSLVPSGSTELYIAKGGGNESRRDSISSNSDSSEPVGKTGRRGDTRQSSLSVASSRTALSVSGAAKANTQVGQPHTSLRKASIASIEKHSSAGASSKLRPVQYGEHHVAMLDDEEQVRQAALHALSKPSKSRNWLDIQGIRAFFDSICFFDNLPDRQRQELCREAILRVLDGDQVVFSQGDPGDSYYLILSGSVSVIVKDKFLNERMVAVLEENESFGELALLQGHKRTATIMTNEPTELLVIEKLAYNRIIKRFKVSGRSGTEPESGSGGKGDGGTTDTTKAPRAFWQRKGSPLSQEERVEKAALFIEDAAHERPLKRHRGGYLPLKVDRFLKSRAYQTLLGIAIVLNMLFVFWEPPSFHDGDDLKYQDRFPYLIASEWICLVFYMFTICLRLYDDGVKWYFRSSLQTSRLTVVGIIFCDVLTASVTGGTSFRFSRALRPALLLSESKQLRKMYKVAVKVVPRMFELVLLLAGMLFCYTVFGFYLFNVNGNVYDEAAYNTGGAPYDNCDGQPCAPVESYVFDSFSSYSQSALSLFVLLTSENYPSILYPAYMADSWFLLFFVSFVVIGLFFFMNLLVVVVYDAYREANAEITMQERVREREALHAAFQCLDYWDTSYITPDVFSKLMKKMRPGCDELWVTAIFSLMDADENGLLDEMEFFEICDMLFLTISRKTDRTMRSAGENSSWLAWFRAVGLSGALTRFLHHRQVHRAIVCLITIDVIALCLMVVDADVMSPIDLLCVCLFTLEALAWVIVQGGLSNMELHHWARLLISTACIGGNVAYLYDQRRLSTFRFIGVVRIFSILRVFSTEEDESKCPPNGSDQIGTAPSNRIGSQRSAVGSDTGSSGEEDKAPHKVERFAHAFIRMVPVYAAMGFALSSVVLYSFSIIGMEAFSSDEMTNRCSGNGTINNDPHARFCNFPQAMLTLFQILTTSNWHDVMYGAMQITASDYAAWFFVLFYIVAVLLIFNLLTAVLLDSFLLEANMKRQREGIQLAKILNSGDQYVTDSDSEYDSDSSSSESEDTNGPHGSMRMSRRSLNHSFAVINEEDGNDEESIYDDDDSRIGDMLPSDASTTGQGIAGSTFSLGTISNASSVGVGLDRDGVGGTNTMTTSPRKAHRSHSRRLYRSHTERGRHGIDREARKEESRRRRARHASLEDDDQLPSKQGPGFPQHGKRAAAGTTVSGKKNDEENPVAIYEASQIMVSVVSSLRRWKRALDKAYQQTDGSDLVDRDRKAKDDKKRHSRKSVRDSQLRKIRRGLSQKLVRQKSGKAHRRANTSSQRETGALTSPSPKGQDMVEDEAKAFPLHHSTSTPQGNAPPSSSTSNRRQRVLRRNSSRRTSMLINAPSSFRRVSTTSSRLKDVGL